MIDQPAWGSPDSEAAVTSRCRDASNDSTNRDKVDRKSTRLNSSHRTNSYAVFCLKKKTLADRVAVILMIQPVWVRRSHEPNVTAVDFSFLYNFNDLEQFGDRYSLFRRGRVADSEK